jgi:hypothetical protein
VVPGLVLARRRLGALAPLLGLGLCAELWVNGAAWDHWGSYAYGARRFTDATVVFAVGIAGCWWWASERLRQKGRSTILGAADAKDARTHGTPAPGAAAYEASAAPSAAQWGRAPRVLTAFLVFTVAFNFLLMELLRHNKIKSSGAGAYPAATWAKWAGAPSWLVTTLDRVGYPFVQPAGWLYGLIYRAPASAFEGLVGNYLIERDWRVHGAVAHAGVAFGDPGKMVPEGLVGAPDANGWVQAATRVRVLAPLFVREPLRLRLSGSFPVPAGGDASVSATWNGVPLAARVERPGSIAFDVPLAITHARSRTNEIVFTLPAGSRLYRLDAESTTTWYAPPAIR